MENIAKLSEVPCENCLEIGTLKNKAIVNDANSDQIHCTCEHCGRVRSYSVKKILKSKDGDSDYIVYLDPVETPVLSGTSDHRSGKPSFPKGGHTMPNSKKKDGKITFYHDSTPNSVPGKHQENTPVANMSNYFDVLSYKLDKDGLPTDDENANRRFPESTEDAAPQNKSIMPRKERLEYREKSKPFQAVANEQNESIDKKPSYVEIGIFGSAHPVDLSDSAKKNLLKASLDNDIDLVKEAGMADSSFIEPGGDGGQWCPKVRHAVPYYVCSHYCIDGRRIPQTDSEYEEKKREFETYKDYLTHGGANDGKVFCGYKDWLKREVTGTYPGWVEDYIEQQGGEVSKNFKPFQHKDNLDSGQRRQMPIYPDHKLIEKRHEIEGHHVYNDQREIFYASDKAKSKMRKISKNKKKDL